MSRIRGLELLFSLVKDQLQSKQDCVVAALHCLLINESLQCVGLGEEFSDADSSTELLPRDWNENQEVYTLRYTSKDHKNKFLVKVVKAGQVMHVNILLNEDITAAMSVNVDKNISDDYNSDFSSTYLDVEGLVTIFRRNILEQLIEQPRPKEKKSPMSSDQQRPPSPSANNSLFVPPRPRPVSDFDDDRFGVRDPFPPIGGRDLDPLGRSSGGGMLFDPFDMDRRGRGPNFPPGLPRGAVPPGARFDPFGPGIPGPNRGRPNPDHFRRPDDFDDFM
ncbi:hypothetical protein JTE90_011999 [Oedothorax gibbosus]|uniref:Proteasome inhibitor PI31 subunit n=1 Tax=Oedothorax gibbosus TaxID=931172 RepID=A0AAV6UPQ2_9ARAC|nr:hypothetical protein JTE90_011999 [Oedothorax gibbosus]